MIRSARALIFAAGILAAACGSSDAPPTPPSTGAQNPLVPSSPTPGASSTPANPSASNTPSMTAPSGGSGASANNTPSGMKPAPGSAGSSAMAAAGSSAPAPAVTMDKNTAGTNASADPPGTKSVTTDAFVLKAGQETYKCQNFDNPFGGKDQGLQRIVTDMSPGSHHLHVYHMTTGASRTLEDCTIADFHPLLFAAGSPHQEVNYPAGMAAKLNGSSGVRIQLHYINTSTKDLNVGATLKMTPAEYSSVTKWVSELYFNQTGLRVMPGMGQTVSTTCTIPQTYGTIGLVYGGTHMHKRGVHFVAKTSTGAMLADVNTWDEPPGIAYDPPVMLKPGDKITWTCTYDNNTGKTLTFGESAENNEMCIYLARFFSAPDGAQLECQANGPTGMTSTRTY